MIKKENNYFIFDRPINYNLKFLIKYVLKGLFDFYYNFKRTIFRPKKIDKKKYKISICAIFKNESKYIKEWIEYHKIVGVDHFYLYNNNSTDDYSASLKRYISDGSVTLVKWEKDQAQMECYNNAIKNYSFETEWIAFIDLDEFIVPNYKDNIYNILKPFQKNTPIVIAYWKMFGTSGLISRDTNNLVTEDFTVCWNKYSNIGKIFYNTSYNLNMFDKHNKVLHHYSWGDYNSKLIPPVNIFGKFCYWGMNPVSNKIDKNYFPLQINHYFTKSYNEYSQKKAKGDVYFVNNPHDEEYFYKHEKNNNSIDYRIYKYLIKLKLVLGKK